MNVDQRKFTCQKCGNLSVEAVLWFGTDGMRSDYYCFSCKESSWPLEKAAEEPPREH